MITLLSRLALALSATTAICCMLSPASADEICCAPTDAVCVSEPVVVDEAPESESAPSWVFRRSTFTNDPMTGARVAQYMRKPPVEPLDDQREVTSSYRRTRTVNRGRDGSMDTSYQVQAWGNGRGGIDAEWQMFNDVWKEAILSGSSFNSNQSFGPWQQGWGNGGPAWGGGGPNGGPPWNNGGPGWGNGVPPWANGGPGWGNGFPGGGGPNGGWPGGPNGAWNGGPNGGWNGGPSGGWNGGWNPNNGQHGGGNGPQMHWPHDGNGGPQQQQDAD